MNANRKHRRANLFALVLYGGGGAGLAHAGVLSALGHYGYRPNAIVGVSMGAVVGATYASNPNWYRDLLSADTTGLPVSPDASDDNFLARLRALLSFESALQDMLFGWGTGTRSALTGTADYAEMKAAPSDPGIDSVRGVLEDAVGGSGVQYRAQKQRDTIENQAKIAEVLNGNLPLTN